MLVGIKSALVILCIVSSLSAHQRTSNSFVEHLNGIHDGHHHHNLRSTDPCEECDPPYCCTPGIQCPPQLRASPPGPCQMGRFRGVCCVVGNHRIVHEQKQRSASTLDSESLKCAHETSEQRLQEWLKRDRHVEDSGDKGTLTQKSSPSYGHHMSMRGKSTPDERKISRSALRSLFTLQSLQHMNTLTDNQLQLGIPHVTSFPFCPPKPSCPPTLPRYRHVSGKCNNLAQPGWGASHTPYERILPASYTDGTWSFRVSVLGEPLPSARDISSELFVDADNPSQSFNLMLTQFGQFLVHDVTGAVAFTTENGSPISCCTEDGSSLLPPELQHEACAPIQVDPRDPFFSQFQVTCLNFVRSQLAPSHDCTLGPAKQMNSVTHYADLSPIYGSSESKLLELRAVGGRLRTFIDFGRELPPLASDPGDCLIQQDGAACFESGDHHINQMISLVSVHTLFIREHNRLADAFVRLNPGLPEDIVFLEARRIVIAEYQHIIFNEWLPLIIGPQMMEEYRLHPKTGGEYSTDYNQHVNPSVTSELAAAALRFGHSTIDDNIKIDGNNETMEQISIPEVMFQPSRMRLREFHDRLLKGLTSQSMQRADNFMSHALTRYMFHGGQPFGLDLASINIQRGRDHGLHSYNDYLRLIGSEPIQHFNQFPGRVAQHLSSLYSSPEDVDLWVGGLLEPELEYAAVGKTFAHIIADQFSRMRRGDRYFYEHGPAVNPGSFTKEQLAEIRKVTLASLICDHSDHIELLQQAPRAFLRPHLTGNPRVSCEDISIPKLDLTKFIE